MEIRSLSPVPLWNHFSDLNAVPRASKKEERVIQFMLDFGKELGLATLQDDVGNVIIKKPASPGMENRETIVMQSHLDMVHQKNADTVFDFDTEGIKMQFVDGWVKADGTTLGADNGIGVATIMAILSSDTIEHPAIEALFTIDEETGMTGALGLKGGLLTGGILLNLDTEDDEELTIGCAGGVDVTATGKYNIEQVDDIPLYKLAVTGLHGGHSGMDIHKGFANANKIMNRILYALNDEIRIQEIDGGGLRNAIPRESFAHFLTSTDLTETVKQLSNDILTEYKITDPNFNIELKKIGTGNQHINKDFQNKLLRSLYACPNGIYRMSPDINGLVQTSNNLARVLVKDGEYQVLCLTRSSVESEKWDLGDAIKSCFELMGAEVDTSGSYPGWAPKPEAAIIKLMRDIYTDRFNSEPHVNACHAGLECGIIGTNYPKMDMISFGPNITGAHSPDEQVEVKSVEKFWGYLMEVLKNIPEKG